MHGEFWQFPENHFKGCGCPKCAKRVPITIAEFIEKAKKIHSDLYDYSLIDSFSESKKIKIICKKHGVFEQYYHHHLQGSGCPFCSNNKKLTTEEFIEKAKKIHNNKYDYSKVKYVNSCTPVCIICPEHGEFWQAPREHLKGHNCPSCNESSLEEEFSLFLDKNNIKYEKEKKYANIKYKKELPFDFYIPKYNTIIECQGMQHFVEKHFFNDSDRFEKDRIKYEGCLKNNIRILYYTNIRKYKDYFNEIYNENNLFNNKNKLLNEIKKSR